MRRGWTTGACATAATRAAYTALLTGGFPDPVTIRLPKGETPSFPLAIEALDGSTAHAGVVKDAGDDPDVTHGALIVATVSRAPAGDGVRFHAGTGVGTVTRDGLAIPVGEPAINPVPRRLMTETVAELAARYGTTADAIIEISVPGGEALAAKTWNPRLGIVGGVSILGTTGVVHPFSCSAWIHSIHRGVDVARANGLDHVAAATGRTSESCVQALYDLPVLGLIDMGDFAGGLLKYVRAHPIPRLTIAGGFAKLTKLGQGMLDLHSGRSQVDFDWLADAFDTLGADPTRVAAARAANAASEVLAEARAAGLALGDRIASAAQATALTVLAGAPVAVEIVAVDRGGEIVGRAGFIDADPPYG